MIRYTPASERKLSLFKTPFENELDPTNRWVRMAELVPWDACLPLVGYGSGIYGSIE